MKGFFGAIGSLKGKAGAARGFRRLAYGGAEAGLYATLATPTDGALQIELAPNPSEGGRAKFLVKWIPYAGHGPETGTLLFQGELGIATK